MLNERIRSLRLSRGISQVDLGRALGVSKQSVSNWENDNIQPSVEMLVIIAQFFSVSTDYLLGLESEDKLDIRGLTEEEISHIRLLVEDLKKNR